jgi:alkylation response protein AidB-like acyl-CoA dehydrogenase
MTDIDPQLEDPVVEFRDWLTDNWDPDLTVGEWWQRLGLAGWSNPLLPTERYGRSLGRADSIRILDALLVHGALGPPQGIGLRLAAPTIAAHGTGDQVERLVRDIVTGQKAWCQLFSEPGAGSDLAGLATKAERDGDSWVVNGQKVWTSLGQIADLGMLLARTNTSAPKHQGITWFAIDMHQDPAIDALPLREMTGHALFSEVFLSDATVADSDRVGEANDGWMVANTTLYWERSAMGASVERNVGAQPGTIAGDLDKRAGDFVRPPSRGRRSSDGSVRMSPAARYIDLARSVGKHNDPVVRQDLARSHILGELSRLNTERHKAARAIGADIRGIANLSKLLMADVLRHNRDMSARILGARATLHAYDHEGRISLSNISGGRDASIITELILAAQALPIYGGTDQIQRNIVSERVLGLPKEPGDLSRVPFNELPRNG